MAGFAVYFPRYLQSCFTECSTVPRLQGNFISAHVCSFTFLLTLSLYRYILEMHTAYTAKNSFDIDTINTLLAFFGITTFRISLMNFFWEKLLTTIGTSFVTTFLWSEKEWKITGCPLSSPDNSFSLFRTRGMLVDCD